MPRNPNWLRQARDAGLVAKDQGVNSDNLSLLTPRSRLQVTLAPPPSTNNLFFNVKGRGRVKTSTYRAWGVESIGILVALKPPSELPCHLHLCLAGKWNERRDIDNVVKPVLDALVAAGTLPGDNLKCVSAVSISYERADCDPIVIVWFSA